MTLAIGDVVALPFAVPHDLGVGANGRVISPLADLPPQPWTTVPILRYGPERPQVRLLCGYLTCTALAFGPLRASLPALLHARSTDAGGRWLTATIEQIDHEVNLASAGSGAVLERLTEIMFVQVLRRHIESASKGDLGWFAAAADPLVGSCLKLMHESPERDWTMVGLAAAVGSSRSVVAERFRRTLGVSPMRYLRDWRLHLAGVALADSDGPIAEIAFAAGYASEAAFNRAFARVHGRPPGAWRQAARLDQPHPRAA